MAKKNVLDVLKERKLVRQIVCEDELYELLGKESVPFYIGFDPTADSLHVGHFLALMAMARLQQAGHKPIVLLGGGTGMIGDPSGRSDLRTVMSRETIEHNISRFREQMSRFLSFEGENAAIMVNNADWLLGLNYIEFLRDIGVHFSVNRMLAAECFKCRLEKGLSFFEFNYMLMQAYDFLVLYKKYGCILQCGGDDQWSNILAGADLIRRKERAPAYAMTFSLLTTSDGRKMGKTQKGAVWLDKEKTSPYEFYQYFRNIDDADVENCLNFLTYIPVDEIKELTRYRDARMNTAKERLAYEVVKIVHGQEEADKAVRESQGAFCGGQEMPCRTMEQGITEVAAILVALNLAASKGEAKRLISGGGIKIDGEKVCAIDAELTPRQAKEGFVIQKGKKTHLKVIYK